MTNSGLGSIVRTWYSGWLANAQRRRGRRSRAMENGREMCSQRHMPMQLYIVRRIDVSDHLAGECSRFELFQVKFEAVSSETHLGLIPLVSFSRWFPSIVSSFHQPLSERPTSDATFLDVCHLLFFTTTFIWNWVPETHMTFMIRIWNSNWWVCISKISIWNGPSQAQLPSCLKKESNEIESSDWMASVIWFFWTNELLSRCFNRMEHRDSPVKNLNFRYTSKVLENKWFSSIYNFSLSENHKIRIFLLLAWLNLN